MIVTGEYPTDEEPSADVGVGRALRAFSAAAFLVSLDRAIFVPLLPALARDLATNVGGAGLAVTAYVLPYGLCQLLYGPLGDRHGRVVVLRWTFSIFALFTGLAGLAPTLPVLVLLRIVTGSVAAAIIPLTLAYIGDAVPYARRHRTIAELMGMTSLGGALSTAVGGVLGAVVSWRAVFALSGVVSLLLAMLLWRLPTDRPAPIGTANPPRYRTVLRSPQARYLFLLVGLEGVVVIGVFTYLGAYLESRFGLNSLASGLILACYGAGTLLASRLFGRIGARLRETERVLCGGGLLGAGFLLLRSLSWWPLAVAPFLAMGIGFALFHSTLQTRATELAPEARGTAIAVFAFTLFLGGAIGTTGSGWLVTTHGYTPLLVGAGATMLAITFGARWSWAR